MRKILKIGFYKIIIKPVVQYWSETSSVTLRDEHMLRVLENSTLRTIFQIRRDEVTGIWRNLHNEGKHNLYFSQNIIRMKKF